MDAFTEARIQLYRERIELLQERLRLRETQLEILREDLEKLKTVAANRPTFSMEPLYYNEAEEDILHARAEQQISMAAAEDMLRELDFDNVEINIDEPDSDLALY